MKIKVAGALALMLLAPILSTAAADEAEELRNECRQVGEQHGITSERMEEWIDRCMGNIRRLQQERAQQGERGHSGQHGEQGEDGHQKDGDTGHRGGEGKPHGH